MFVTRKRLYRKIEIQAKKGFLFKKNVHLVLCLPFLPRTCQLDGSWGQFAWLLPFYPLLYTLRESLRKIIKNDVDLTGKII